MEKIPLQIVGEVHFDVLRDDMAYTFDGLVARELDPPIIAGNPFLERHNVMIAPAKRQVVMGPGRTYTYGGDHSETQRSVWRCTILQAPAIPTTVYPGESIEVPLPQEFLNEMELAL